MQTKDLPNILPVFPLSNFIIFPKTSVPLNIFEPRYIDMINDCMRSNKFIGIIQPQNSKDDDLLKPKLYNVGCMGKITSFNETDDGRFLIELKGIIRCTLRHSSILGYLLTYLSRPLKRAQSSNTMFSPLTQPRTLIALPT